MLRRLSDHVSPADLATLSLLDPDQGVCPAGHPCRLDNVVGRRRCAEDEYSGYALICWDLTREHLEAAVDGGADPMVVEWARSFLDDRS